MPSAPTHIYNYTCFQIYTLLCHWSLNAVFAILSCRILLITALCSAASPDPVLQDSTDLTPLASQAPRGFTMERVPSESEGRNL